MSCFDVPGKGLSRRSFLQAFAVSAVMPMESVLAAPKDCPAFPDFPNKAFLDATKRGVNLTGWDAEDVASRPSRKQLKALRQYAFTHIRLPIDNRRLETQEAYLTLLRNQIGSLIEQGYAVSVDLHADEKVGALFRRDKALGETYLTGLWDRMATQLVDTDPRKVAIELLNEPQLEQALWVDVAGRLAARMRSILSDTTFIIGPSGPQRHEILADMQPIADPNVIYAIHYYDPVLFTHQGADWGAPDDASRFVQQAPFPAKSSDREIVSLIAALEKKGHHEAAAELRASLEDGWSEAAMKDAFDLVSNWSMRHQRPVIINEFGVLSFVAPRQSRLQWLAAVNRLARERCLGWAHWDFQDGFGLIDKRTGLPDKDIMKALS